MFTGGIIMKENKDALFKFPHWNEYHSVKVLKTKIKPTDEDKKSGRF